MSRTVSPIRFLFLSRGKKKKKKGSRSPYTLSYGGRRYHLS